MLDMTAVMESKSTTGNTWRFTRTARQHGQRALAGSGTLTFDNNGKLQSSTGTSVTMGPLGHGSDDAASHQARFWEYDGAERAAIHGGHGHAGRVSCRYAEHVFRGDDGTITRRIQQPGRRARWANWPLATFTNIQDSVEAAGNLYQSSAGSGAAGQIQLAGQFRRGRDSRRVTGTEPTSISSTEFTKLIGASTGFSARARSVTTTQQLMQQLSTRSGIIAKRRAITVNGDFMISLTAEWHPFVVNAEESVHRITPDTIVCCDTGEKLMVRETLQEVMRRRSNTPDDPSSGDRLRQFTQSVPLRADKRGNSRPPPRRRYRTYRRGRIMQKG